MHAGRFADRVEAGRRLGEDLNARGLGAEDGVATGSTAVAVGRWLAGAGARRRILAVPVAPPQTVERLGNAYDEVYVLATPPAFFAVGEFYADFRQVTDDEVRQLLRSRDD